MFYLLSSSLTAYLAAAGLMMTSAVAGRGLVRSVRLAAQGHYGAAGLQALAALATPAVLAQTATAKLFLVAIDAGRQLSGKTLKLTERTQHAEKAA